MELEQEEKAPKKSGKSEMWEWIKAIAIAVVLVILIRWLVFKPFIVDGPSMQPNFHTGERLIVSEWVYKFRKPHRGEVVVFHATETKDYIKRVIALPGEKIKISDGVVYINDQPLDEPYIKEAVEQYRQTHTNMEYNADFPETTVEAGHVFVMGDNRVDSQDSRMIGSIPYSKVIGRADIVFWPLSDLSFIKHSN
ncbi:signal peptidase I [Gorillibacterium massiliense]|uniref:signal peptidase I n=1 Tax=Gorillibacterium massiliense TaxID=1280390 RepID=UPI0004BC79E0